MIDKHIKIVQDISLLYELSLAIGNSLSFEENCYNFIKSILARKNLAYGGIWVLDNSKDTDGNQFKLTFDFPNLRTDEEEPKKEKIFDKIFEDGSFAIVKEEDDDFSAIAHQNGVESGAYILFGMPEVGVIQFYTSKPDNFTHEDCLKLTKVILKFSVILKGCIAFESLKTETSEKIKFQEALYKSEQEYRLMVNSIAEGIVITDLEGRIIFVNEQMCLLTGYTLEEVKGKKPADVFLAEGAQKLEEERLELRKKDISDSYVLEHKTKNGDTWFAQVKASPYKDIKGNIIGTVGAAVDITDKYKAEKLLLESEEKFRKVLFNALDAIVIIDKDFKVLEWNSQAEKIFRYPVEYVSGNNLLDLIVDKTTERHAVNEYLERINESEQNDRIELVAVDSFGKNFNIELSAISITVKGESMMSLFIRDITKRKENEEALIRAKQKAEAARIAEQQFLATMSHEIRTPMNSVIGMTHLLSKTTMDNKQSEYLKALSFSAESLLGIINDILDFSKIEAGEITFEKKPFDLFYLCRSLVTSFTLKEKPLEIKFSYDNKINQQLEGDFTRLNQILSNLLGNAYKFTKEGHIGLHVKMVERQNQQVKVQFDISDTGVGIPANRLDSIFESFKQADRSITRKFGGTGLGLAIVKQLVTLQGGEIKVKSEIDKGSTFSITLPFRMKLASETEAKRPVLVEDNPEVELQIKQGKYLIVEDNLMNQRLIKEVFRLWNCEKIQFAENGIEAVEKTEKEAFDLILMDLHMPEMDGFEATANIRANEHNPNTQIPIIALTATVLQKDKDRAYSVGINDFLPKPFRPENLKGTLYKWLKLETSQKEQVQAGGDEGNGDFPQYDLEALKAISKDNNRFLLDMINIFLETVPSNLMLMKEHHAAKEWKELSLVAHKVKSSFSSVGMLEQTNDCIKIERLVDANDFDTNTIGSIIAKLNTSAQKIYPMLKMEFLKIRSSR